MLSIKSFRVFSSFLLLFTIPFFNFLNAHAADINSMTGIMCNGYLLFSGNLGKTFAVFAIVALGVGFFLGKVSWGTAIAIALGIGALFGAPVLVRTITGGTTTICSTSANTDVLGLAPTA